MHGLLCCAQVGDGVLGTSQGVLRGLGRQGQLMLLNTVAFWCVGVPAGWWLTFRRSAGLWGLWGGMALGCFLAAAGSLALVLSVDWHKEVERLQTAAGAQQAGACSSAAEKQGGGEVLNCSDHVPAAPLLVAADGGAAVLAAAV